LTNPSSWLAQQDFSDTYPYTSCVRVDGLGAARGPLGALLRIAKWLRQLELPV
jgi:hypothetical protein